MDIRLSAPAVRALITDDEQFSLELSRAVIAEIVKKLPSQLRLHIDTAILHEIARQTSELTKEIKGGSYSYSFKTGTVLADKTAVVVKQSVEEHLAAALQTVIRTANEAAEKKVEALNNEIEARINRRIDAAINDEVNKRVAARLSAVLAAASAT